MRSATRAPALSAGNRAIIKPSELAPASAALVARLVAEALPDDHVAVVTGGPEVGEALAGLPLDHLFFTGSPATGRAVLRAASTHLTPVTLELGGKSPVIVGHDFPVAKAAQRIMAGKLFNAGQTCLAPDYALVPESLIPSFVDACRKHTMSSYPLLADNPDYTPIWSAAHWQRLQGYLTDARARGAHVVEAHLAGEHLDPRARKLTPTLVLDATCDLQVMQEEIFGPILPVVAYRELDDAIAWGFETFSKQKPVYYQRGLDLAALLRPPYGSRANVALEVMLR